MPQNNKQKLRNVSALGYVAKLMSTYCWLRREIIIGNLFKIRISKNNEVDFLRGTH